MNRLFRFERKTLSCLNRHTLCTIANRLSFARFNSVEERRNHCIHELCVAGCVLMIGVGNIAISPLPVTFVDSSEHISRWNVPFVNEQVELLHIIIVIVIVVASSIVVHHHRNLAVSSYLINKCEHIVTPLIEDTLLVACPMNAFVSKRKTKDDITTKVANQVIITIQKIDCGVASNRNIRGVEGIFAPSFIMASNKLLTIKVTIALVISRALTIRN